MSRDINKGILDGLAQFPEDSAETVQGWPERSCSRPTSVIDRFATTGIINKPLLRPLNITGPAARASGGKVDVRVNHPYGIYDRYALPLNALRDGDVLSRFTVKASEIMDSVDLIGNTDRADSRRRYLRPRNR